MAERLAFQFYLSSIKSDLSEVVNTNITGFQFYLSSIKSSLRRLVILKKLRFNSTLVQLKG